MESTYNKGYFKAFIFLLVFVIILPVFASIELPKGKKTYAVNDDVKFDETAVLDDLTDAVIDGKTFNVANYPKDPRGALKIIAFMEYCYSYYENTNVNYGLYIYVYNPVSLNLSENVGQNKIQIANKFDNNGNPADWKKHPTDYSKFNLKFLNKSDNQLFYKYKVVDNDFKLFENIRSYEAKHSGVRRYYVSGVELLETGKMTAIDYTVATMFEYSGFANGYGPNDNFPLKTITQPLEVAELDVRNTFFRSETSSKGPDYQNQLDSVYFGADNSFFERYGSLQKIKAEWYEYKTKEIIVTQNENVFNFVKSHLGVNMSGSTDHSVWLAYKYYYEIAGPNKADWSWNVGGNINFMNPVNTLYYIFKVDDIDKYDPYSDKRTVGGVESNVLYEWIKTESLKYGNYLSDVKEGNKLSANLFENYVDAGRKRGYNSHNFDADIDLQKMISYKDGNPSFWNKLNNYGFWSAITGSGLPQESSSTLTPIYIVTDDDMKLSNSEIVSKLKIEKDSVNAFKSYYNSQKAAGKKTVLFRFAVTDYFSGKLYSPAQAYMARETCFFDFDILTLTFVKDKIETVVPCVSSPIDIVNAITPPVNDGSGCSDFWNTILIVFLVLLLLFLLWLLSPVLPVIVSGAVAIVTFPVKAVKKATNAFKKDKNKKSQKQYNKSGSKNYERKKRY